jgi:hypothetical protein
MVPSTVASCTGSSRDSWKVRLTVDVGHGVLDVADRDDGRVVHGAQVDEGNVVVARHALDTLRPAVAHRTIDLGGGRERVGRIDPRVLMLARVLAGHEDAALPVEEVGRDGGREVVRRVPPEHTLVAAVREKLDLPQRAGLSPADRRNDERKGSATDACPTT